MLDFIIIAVILVIIFIFKPEKKIESSEVNISDYCEGNKCKNTCQKINATQMKPGGDFEFGLDSDGNVVPDIKFQASDCDEGTKLIQNFSLCNGGDDSITGDRLGEVECTSDDCCIHKTCGADREYSLEDKLDYLLATNNITQSEMDTIMAASTEEQQLEGLFPQANAALSSDRRRTLDVKTNRDGYCPYQQKAVNPSTECNGETTGIGGDCTIDECCVPKNCANDWVNNENPEWGIGTECPHQTGPAADRGNDMLKYPDDTACDTCDISECCFEQTNFCIVEANDVNNPNSVYNHANTNVGNVGFPSGTNLSFPGNDNTSVDLTTNYFLRKTDVSQTNIQNLLSFGIEDGSDTEDPRYGIKCEDGFKYGMCNASDAGTDDNTCKTHDNNQRECEAAGCSFTLGDRPRVDYSECGDTVGHTPGHNIIKVGNCIDTCTADHTLTDGDINYFTQTPLDNGSYRVNPLYDNTGKNSGQEFESGTNVRKYCNNYFGTGEARTYSYTCGGGGSYFTVDELENCNSTCGELRSQGANCAENKIYPDPETDPDTNSLPSNFADFNENCCIPKTCNNGSSGTEIGCRNYETKKTDFPVDESGFPVDESRTPIQINSNNCCERLTCSDYLDEFNRVSVGGGHEVITSENICNSGTFRPENPVSFAYLNSFTSGGSDTEKYNIFKSYQTGVPIGGDTSVVDIGCCQQLTCQEWANHPDNIPGNIPGESEQTSANRYCNNNNGDGINVFNMSGTFNGNSLDEAVEPGNNSCCISSENITCSPSDELMNPASLVGYNGINELHENPGPIEFEYNRDISTFSTVVGHNPYDGVTCTGDGTPSLQCTRDADGDNHRYTLTGCNVEPNENVCDEGQSLANGSPKFCVLPNLQDGDHHGVVLSNFITGVSENAIVNVRNFAHQLDNIQCENSTFHPCMRECTNDVLTTPYSGVLTERTQEGEGTYSEADYDSSVHIHIEGCDYKNDFSTTSGGQITNNFFMDQYYNGNNGYSDCFELYEPRRATGSMPDDFDKSKINVKHFKCHCEGTQEVPEHPNYGGQLAERCDPSLRHIRFKYVFDDDPDYLTDDKRHITNSDALSRLEVSYIRNDILNERPDGTQPDSICEPGYYPYRGDTEDYCKPCTDLYKNNHPISAISERFCNSGHLFDSSSNSISLLPRPDIGSTEYNSNIDHPDISTLRAVRTSADGTTSSNLVYSPYFGADLTQEITDINNDIDFMTADNFTLGTRVCDSEPDSGTTCSPKVKIYGDYDQPATEGSQFDKAKKWWRTYFNNNFNIGEANTDNSDILDISSAPSETTIPDNKPTLKSRINDSGTLLQPPSEFTINDITDLKKEHYLYRNNLEIHTPADTTPIPISTVCNNNTPDVDYIPSFNSVGSNEGSNEGECKACVNEMPSNANTLRQNGDAPFNSPGEDIVRNINNNNYAPICSYEANMYNESYNEGNIVGFKSITTGEIYAEDNTRGPCNEGFIYYRDGYNLATSLISDRQELAPYVKCFPQTKLITKFCENITDEVICNKSFSTGLSDYENDRLSNQLNGELDTDEQILSDEQIQMINNAHTNGFCGWVTNVDADDNRVGECKNIYDTVSNGGYLIHKSPGSLPQAEGVEDYSNHKSLYNQQSVLDYLSPHITSYTTSIDYNYSNFYNNNAILTNWNDHQDVTPYREHETHDGDNIKAATDAVFNISNYGVGKGGVTASVSNDLTNLSIANALKEGYDPVRPSFYDLMASNFTILNFGDTDLNHQPLRPTRINPYNTKLNDTMINRCHPILWDGPVDFFYENNHFTGANGETTPKTTISSSCYLRDGSISRYLSSTGGWHIVPDGSGDYSIKSTPLYYNKGRNLQGGILTNTDYSENDYTHNILNPGPRQDGIMYARNYQDYQDSEIYQYDSGFSDAAIFPLIDRVRGCFNDSLIYGSQNRPSNSSLGLDADNIDNEREQCIFHWNHSSYTGFSSVAAKGCVNACLNNNECDLVRMKKDSSGGQTRCELLKWNKLPNNIRKMESYLYPGRERREGDTPPPDITDDSVIKNYHLGGHLINANEEYDQSTRQGVVNWYNRITAPQATEMNHEVTIGDDGYRTEFYSWKSLYPNSDIREWRTNNLMGSGSSGDTIQIKGRPLWERSTDDNEIWISMNKIRAPPPDGKIGDILNHINENELPDIQPIDSGGNEWRFSYTGSSAINEEDTYYTNDSSTTYPNKYNEKTVNDSNNNLQCPPGTYVQDNNGGYKCSQVINECASCQDIYDYHDKKGDFEGMDDTAKNNLLDSYGTGRCSVSNTGTVSGTFRVYINKEKWQSERGQLGGAMGPGSRNTTHIMDSTGTITLKTNVSGSTFPNQHNLMAKTPDGNIIDAEKCMCPGNELVNAWAIGGSGHGMAQCGGA